MSLSLAKDKLRNVTKKRIHLTIHVELYPLLSYELYIDFGLILDILYYLNKFNEIIIRFYNIILRFYW